MTEDSGPFIPGELRPEVGGPSDAPVPGPDHEPEELARLAREAMPPERREGLGVDPPAGDPDHPPAGDPDLDPHPDLDWQATVQPSPDLSTQELEGELLILDLASSQYYSLNDVGTAMWGLLERGGTLEHTANAICERYDATQAQVRGDLATLVRDLEQKRLITLRAPSAPPDGQQ